MRALKVISRTSSSRLKGTTKRLPEIARDLGVRYVVEGTVRRAGDSLRITAQLIDPATDTHLWAEKYTGTLADVFDLQEKLSRRIVQALEVSLTSEEDRRFSSRAIPNEHAYALYLRARREMLRMTAPALDVAVHLIESALERTGPDALLLATAAEVRYWTHEQSIRPGPEVLDRVDRLVASALELDPDLAEAHMVAGMTAFRRSDGRGALRHLGRAVALDPGSAEPSFYLAYTLAEVGRSDQARSQADRAIELDPLLWPALFARALSDFVDGAFEAALPFSQRMWELAGEATILFWWRGLFLLYAGRLPEARAAAESVPVGALVEHGVFPACRRSLEALITRDVTTLRSALSDESVLSACRIDREVAWCCAAAFASAGEADEALDWLGTAIYLGFVNHVFFSTHDPFLARLRGNPRFEALMDRARAKQREIEAEA